MIPPRAIDRNGVRVVAGDCVRNRFLPDGGGGEVEHQGRVQSVDGDVILVAHRGCSVKDCQSIDYYMAAKWEVLR